MSNVVNFYEYPLIGEISHGGEGIIQKSRVLSSRDFETNIDFIDYIIVPPNTTIGLHAHGENEELYIILNGSAEMTVESKNMQVNKGDIIINRRGMTHALRNNTDVQTDILIIQNSMR